MNKKIPSHSHKASDIVECVDDYLLPYLRSARDPSKIERAIIEGSEPLPEGTAFPVEPHNRQFFRLTQTIEGYPAALYRYDAATDAWVRLQPVRFEGTTYPTGIDFITGDIFWNTNQKKDYEWDGDSWEFVGTPDHGTMDGLEDDDHTQYHTTARHSVIEHTASMLNQAIQPYNSNILFERKSGFEHNAITYTAGEIKFQDGTARTITPAGELTALPVGYNFIYFKTDSASLFATTNHATAISSGRGLLAIIIVVSADDPDKPCSIQPFYAKGLNITADVISCILLSAITSHLGNVDVADGDVLIGDDGIKIFGEALKFYDSNEVLRGYLFGSTADRLSLFSAHQFYLDVLETKVLSTIFPSGTGIDLGKDGIPFDNVYANSFIGTLVGGVQAFVSKPAASSHPREIIVVRSGADNKSYVYVSVKNDANAWEWIQVGIST